MQQDWSVDMRWKMQEIVQNLFLGPYNVALKLELLQAIGIQTIIIVKSKQESFIKEFYPEKFQYWTIIASNSNNTCFHFDESCQFIQRELDLNRKVLVHCVGGISRAPTIVIAYLIYSNMSFEQAYQLVQTKRMCVNPLDVFMMQLTVFYSNRAMNSI